MLTTDERLALIDSIRRLPEEIEKLVAGLTVEQLTTPYLEGEWTVAQNVHHLVDAHVNGYIRCKLTLTEEHPPLKPYDQDAWATFPDAQTADITDSMLILKYLHRRWVDMFSNLPDDVWGRVGIHHHDGEYTVDGLLRHYAHHGELHIDQIQRTLAAQS